MKKIAIVTDDGETISQHFGRAAHYLVFTVDEENTITEKELRDKAGHRQFVNEPHDHEHDHDHDHHDHSQGHGFGNHSDHKHARMIEAIIDCEAIIVRGMGRGAYIAMETAQIKPIVTDIPAAEDAVKAYLAGDIVDHTEKLH
ncbi:MAG: dinitrogenase iron-molybdenum cofactor biosynthesis protein [Anaerolineae bacterium]|nr:dinitrogenase iron-molybdenum cofactor biosynthesis protein [Anaerolineae bacterium]